jgi:hypothetical protein
LNVSVNHVKKSALIKYEDPEAAKDASEFQGDYMGVSEIKVYYNPESVSGGGNIHKNK